MMKKLIQWLLPTLFITAILFFFTNKHTGFSGITSKEEVQPEEKSFYAIFPVELPEELVFAGENVPLERFDIAEALDRELLSNTYFHSQTIRLIKMANRYFPVIEKVLAEEGVPEDFKYLAMAESGLENVTSPAGAVGYWQLKKGTAIDYGLEITNEVDERYHLEKSTKAACDYLKESFEKYGNWTMAAASYNVGRRGIDRQVDRQQQDDYYDLLLNSETARYLFRILAFKLILEEPKDYGFHISENDLYQAVPYESIEISSSVADFAAFASAHNTTYKLLKIMNPWLREKQLTNSAGKTYELRIPLEQ